MHKEKLLGYTLSEVELVLTDLEVSPLLAREVCIWMYRRGCHSFLQMKSIPSEVRHKLDAKFSIESLQPQSSQTSKDETSKYLFTTENGNPFETAYMPSGKRNTLCISTQSGCQMGCSFCYTGSLGLIENLSTAQILSQLLAIPQRQQVNRIVLMGMGEPLENPDNTFRTLEILNAQWGFSFGAANITLSTVGIIPQLERLVNSRYCNIAISLHSPFAKQRSDILPSENSYPIENIVDFFRQHPLKKPLRLSFEYVVVPGENDSQGHANGVSELLSDLKCHVNVIPLNSKKSNNTLVKAARVFQQKLNQCGTPATLRLSRGHDIDAACGMMAGNSIGKKN
ncbi:MAG: 23S rRNA (adenine(2503)-C(2))-methyltransferase RlmN [Tenuifilaceae bacterium]|jgi:23S rRNA (adenine2503-C2)-methyltransferase|nr:23S rRNA (adenine(2503)-C(2))-methyltransferase RlmN [Tenuifilaceae bacterium]